MQMHGKVRWSMRCKKKDIPKGAALSNPYRRWGAKPPVVVGGRNPRAYEIRLVAIDALTM